jgi:hypothetical protein
VSRLLDEAEGILDAAERARLEPALLGGLAVRAWAGTLPRETLDVDLVLPDAVQVEGMARFLADRGFRVLDDPGWRRAVHGGPDDRIVVDWTGPDVPDPRTLAAYHLRPCRVRRRLHTRDVRVVGIGDLFVLKVLAGRDQDLADLVLLVDLPCRPSSAEVLECARTGSAGDRFGEQVLRLCTGLHTGETAEAVARVVGREVEQRQVARLDDFARELWEGLRR